MNSVRIFIASPADVGEERRLAVRVVERLHHEFAQHIHLSITAWEREPLLASADFQSQINTPADADIFISLMWSRLGSPLGDQYVRDDGSTYDSGTEYEFETALESFRATGRPSMLVYRKTRPLEIDSEFARLQMSAVDRFFAKWFANPDQTAKAAFHKFSESALFEDVLELHLRRLVADYIPNPNNLPAAATPFIGREAILNSVRDLVLQEQVRLVTLVGPGGTGKTRLGLQVGAGLLKQFADGVFFVSLVSLKDPELVPSAIADTLGIRETDGRSDTECIIDELRGKNMLLLIDNLEQVQSGGRHLATILAACVGVKCVVTSREALRIKGAKTIRVPPFELPDFHGAPVADLLGSEAVRLFVERAQAVRADFQLTDKNAFDVIEICRRVDALPLGIELAASRIRSMNPSRLLSALEQRFKVLTSGSDDLLDHQKSLRELIEWSYDLLDDEEQRLWRRLAVFPGGCSFEAAQEVCDPDNEYMIEIDVESLIDKSLVNIQFEPADQGEGGETSRLSMFSTLREYALEQLIDQGEFDLFNERFCDWCVKYAGDGDKSRSGPKLAQWLTTIDLEYDNIHHVLEQAKENTSVKAQVGVQLSGAIWFYWYERGNFSEGVTWLEWAVSTDVETNKVSRGRALLGLSPILRQQNRLDDANRYAQSALDLYGKLDDDEHRANALGELGAIAQRRGDYDQARRYLDECIALASTQPDNKRGMSFYLTTRGVVDHLRDDFAAAKAHYEEALAIGSELGDKNSIATALVNLGEIAEQENCAEDAYRYYNDSLRLFGELRMKLAVAYCSEVLAGLEMHTAGEPIQAAFYLGAAELMREELNAPIESFNAERLERDIGQTREAMEEEEFRTAWEAGRGLGMDGVLRRALGERSGTAAHVSN